MGQLANTCNQLRNLGNNGTFKRTEHTTIMDYLGRRAKQFRKNGRSQGEDMEKIISELKGAEEGDVTREMEDSARVAERTVVHEAITEGLLQPHGLPPNTKQDGIFRLLCENPNGFNNRITGNWKLNKAIDLKDELKADGLLYCEHRLNLKHRDNQNNFKQMFQWKIACQAVAGHNTHMNVSKIQEGGTGMVTLETQQGTFPR